MSPRPFVISGCLAAVAVYMLPSPTAAQDTVGEKEPKKVSRKDFRESWWGSHPYSDLLGFTLWKSEGTTLREVTEIPELSDERWLAMKVIKRIGTIAGLPEGEAERLYNQTAEQLAEEEGRQYPVYDRVKGFTMYTAEEYEKNRLTARLGIYTSPCADDAEHCVEDGSAVLFSIRDSFAFYNYTQEGASFNYVSGDNGSELKLKGALVTDFYPDSIYSKSALRGPISRNPYRISIRSGLEFDWDQSLDTPVERTSFYLLSNFQANPDQSAHFFGSRALSQIISPQFVQLGAAYDHDSFSGEGGVRWIASWQPRFFLLNDYGVFGRTLGINHLMRYKQGEFLKFYKGENEAEVLATEKPEKAKAHKKESPWYSVIPMDLRASGGSDVWEAIVASEGDFDKVNLEWKTGFIVGNEDWRFRCGYLCQGLSSLSDLGDTTIGHTVFAELGLGMFTGGPAQRESEDGANRELPKGDIGAATIFAEYTFGEHAPTFQDREEFHLGMRVKF